MERNYQPAWGTWEPGEFEATQRAFIDDVDRIGELFPEASARRYLEESDQALDHLVGKLSDEEVHALLCVILTPEEYDQVRKGPPDVTRNDYECWRIAQGVVGVRETLSNFLIAALCEGKKDNLDGVLTLRTEDLLPRQSEEEVRRNGGVSYLMSMRRQLHVANVFPEQLQDACYAEFVEHIKAYCSLHPEGLVVSTWYKIRLIKEGEQFILRKG